MDETQVMEGNRGLKAFIFWTKQFQNIVKFPAEKEKKAAGDEEMG